MTWRRPGRRALVAALTVVAALLPISLVAAVSAFAGDGGAPPAGGNSGAGPAIVGFSPQQGPIGGGTVVHVSGGGFEGVTGVSFGGHPARSFQVKSENLIDAVAPALPRGLNVPIVVAASGGAATSNHDFTFIGCHVPRLKDDRVERAHKALVAAGCRAGEVQRARGARAPLRVIGESPRPGLWLEPASPVDLRVR
jgi:IPT/TIG domain